MTILYIAVGMSIIAWAFIELIRLKQELDELRKEMTKIKEDLQLEKFIKKLQQ